MEFRRYERLDVDLDATIHGDNLDIPAVVENLSFSGARLGCLTTLLRSGDVIDITAEGHSYRSTVVWTAALHIGVNFQSPPGDGPFFELLSRGPAISRPSITPASSMETRPDRKMI